MTSLQVEYQQSSGPDPTAPGQVRYVLVATVLSAVNVDSQVFLYRTLDDAFTGVAVLLDLLQTPPSKAQAVAEKSDFYRTPTATLTFGTSGDAAATLTTLRVRLGALVTDWKAYQTAAFGGRLVETYGS